MMNEGFKIICLKCGKESIFAQDRQGIKKDNDIISILPTSYDGDIGIFCDCGNEAKEGY